MSEISVRMGELAITAEAGVVLVSIGLGSCIGLALVDAGSGIAGLAHIMLPGPGEGEARAGATFADTGVPALLDAVLELGAHRIGLVAVLVGGAQMFGAKGTGRMQVGARNEAAVREALRAAHIRVRAAETGGSTGRTIRVYAGDGCVTARAAGGLESAVLGQLAVTA